ncbi:MAG: hypothetical protein OXU96_05540 [Gammaproteobacteria bacterium]|nr:hypothetical protein [Gammaproteobacteria bacterium]
MPSTRPEVDLAQLHRAFDKRVGAPASPGDVLAGPVKQSVEHRAVDGGGLRHFGSLNV